MRGDELATANGGERPRVLIVDDDPTVAAMLSLALTEDGYEVTAYTDGQEMQQRIEELQPAVVLLDILLPAADGWTVLREIRRTPAGKRLPIVLMSGAWRAHEKQREIGGTRTVAPTVVLPKPFSLDDLERTLHQLGVRQR